MGRGYDRCMGIIKLLVRFLWAAFEIADAAVQFLGGWVIVWGAGWAMLAALWGFVIEAGPITIPAAFAAAAASMIFFDAVKTVYLSAKKASKDKVMLASDLGALMLEGTDILYRLQTRANIPTQKEVWDWMERSVSAVTKTNLADEVFGLKSISDVDRFQDKLRRVAMRFMKENGIQMTAIDGLKK